MTANRQPIWLKSATTGLSMLPSNLHSCSIRHIGLIPMKRILSASIFYLLGVFGPVIAADAPSQALTPTASAQSSPTFDLVEARKAFAVRDGEYCLRVTGGEIVLHECLEAEAEYAEQDLNDAYREVMAHLPPNRRNALRHEERSWIKWRKTECRRQVKDAEECVGGCGVPWTMRLVCMTNEAYNRTQKLKAEWFR